MDIKYVFTVLLVCACVHAVMSWALKKKHRNVESENASALESDMLLSKDQLDALLKGGKNATNHRFKRKAVAHDMYRWPQGVLVYEFDPSLPEAYKQYFRSAASMWTQQTCIRFREYGGPSTSADLGHTGRVLVSPGALCESAIGFQQNARITMHLGGECMDPDLHPVGHTAHEIGHALGLYHEQSRPDRDDHLSVMWQNIKPGGEANFHKYEMKDVETEEPYDFGSVMHYSALYFSKDQDGFLYTMEPKKSSKRPIMGQRETLSFFDIKTINDLYECSAKCPPIFCRNGGYLGSNCKCNCPDGVTGPQCADVVPSTTNCGGKFTAMSGVIQSPGDASGYYDNVVCHWLIEGPPGASISLRFDVFDVEDDPICEWDYVEIRDDGPTMAGSRYCGRKDGFTVNYEGNALYIRMKTDDSNGGAGFKATYTISEGGGWESWNEWGSCSRPCGGGTRTRTRSCPSRRCHGDFTETSPCNGHTCTS